MKPSGTLLGSWRRSNRAFWARLLVMGIALAACVYYAMRYYGAADQSSLLVFVILGFILLMIVVWDVRRELKVQERGFELYTNGCRAKAQDDGELYAYRWGDVLETR